MSGNVCRQLPDKPAAPRSHGLRLRVRGVSVCGKTAVSFPNTRDKGMCKVSSQRRQVCHPTGEQVLSGHRETDMTGKESFSFFFFWAKDMMSQA